MYRWLVWCPECGYSTEVEMARGVKQTKRQHDKPDGGPCGARLKRMMLDDRGEVQSRFTVMTGTQKTRGY